MSDAVESSQQEPVGDRNKVSSRYIMLNVVYDDRAFGKYIDLDDVAKLLVGNPDPALAVSNLCQEIARQLTTTVIDVLQIKRPMLKEIVNPELVSELKELEYVEYE